MDYLDTKSTFYEKTTYFLKITCFLSICTKAAFVIADVYEDHQLLLLLVKISQNNAIYFLLILLLGYCMVSVHNRWNKVYTNLPKPAYLIKLINCLPLEREEYTKITTAIATALVLSVTEACAFVKPNLDEIKKELQKKYDHEETQRPLKNQLKQIQSSDTEMQVENDIRKKLDYCRNKCYSVKNMNTLNFESIRSVDSVIEEINKFESSCKMLLDRNWEKSFEKVLLLVKIVLSFLFLLLIFGSQIIKRNFFEVASTNEAICGAEQADIESMIFIYFVFQMLIPYCILVGFFIITLTSFNPLEKAADQFGLEQLVMETWKLYKYIETGNEKSPFRMRLSSDFNKFRRSPCLENRSEIEDKAELIQQDDLLKKIKFTDDSGCTSEEVESVGNVISLNTHQSKKIVVLVRKH